VGTDLASHSQPVDIRNEALLVEVDHPGWLQMLHMKKERILRQIAKKFPDLTVQNLQMRLVSAGNWSHPQETADTSSRSSGGSKRPDASHSSTSDSSASEGTAADAGENATSETVASRDQEEALSKIKDEKLRSTLERLYRELHSEETQADEQGGNGHSEDNGQASGTS
jgi:hypothetical protein